MKDEEEEMITTQEAAELRGVTGSSIRELIQRGRLRAKMMYGRLLVYRSEVENFKREKPGPRGPRKSAKKKQ